MFCANLENVNHVTHKSIKYFDCEIYHRRSITDAADAALLIPAYKNFNGKIPRLMPAQKLCKSFKALPIINTG